MTRRDYGEMLIPKLKSAVEKQRKFSCYCALGRQFTRIDAAAAWEDFHLGVEHPAQWQRVAIVTDIE